MEASIRKKLVELSKDPNDKDLIKAIRTEIGLYRVSAWKSKGHIRDVLFRDANEIEKELEKTLGNSGASG